jgi:hypothetical protein
MFDHFEELLLRGLRRLFPLLEGALRKDPNSKILNEIP